MLKNKLMLPILAVIVGVAASAFTAPHKNHKAGLTDYLFYREISAPPHSTNASDYVYDPSGACTQKTGDWCSANFLQSSPPTIPGEHPSGTYDNTPTSSVDKDYVPSF